ncbi:MAG: hypothetical protein V3T26_05940 [candidate division NC10 bacterium]
MSRTDETRKAARGYGWGAVRLLLAYCHGWLEPGERARMAQTARESARLSYQGREGVKPSEEAEQGIMEGVTDGIRDRLGEKPQYVD